MDGLVAIVSL